MGNTQTNNNDKKMDVVHGIFKSYSCTNLMGILPRHNLTLNYEDSFSNDVALLNIYFQMPTGNKISVTCPASTRIKDIIRNFIKKANISEKDSNLLYYIYNGHKLDKNENRTIAEMGMLNTSAIVVIDSNSVIGA